MPLTCTPGGGAAAVAAWAAVAVPADSSSAAAATSMIRFIGPSPGSRGQHQLSKGREQVRDGITPLSGGGYAAFASVLRGRWTRAHHLELVSGSVPRRVRVLKAIARSRVRAREYRCAGFGSSR